jgi:AcrR family transcriptional regulator
VDAVEAIFEATGQLGEADGLSGLTIARIAEVAGYGAGAVYDYFPTKKAILIAMARPELDRTFQSIEAAILSGEDNIDSMVSRSAIRAMIALNRATLGHLLSRTSEGMGCEERITPRPCSPRTFSTAY